MNLYIKLLTRELLPTSQFEKWLQSRMGVLERYRKVEGSAEFKEYQELSAKVNQSEFQATRNEMLNTQYGNTYEGKTMAKLRRLGFLPDVLVYQSMLDNKNIQEFLAFAADPKEFAKLNDPDLVATDEKLKRMLKLSQSLLIKDFYRRQKGRFVREYIKLKEEVGKEEFKKRNLFWQNPQRWYTLPESEIYSRYDQLKNSSDIQFYETQKKEEIDRIDKYNLTFFDQFDWKELSQSAWKPGFVYPSKDFVSVHSYTNEQQAYNNGKNIRVEDGTLYIDTKKESVTAPAWDAKKGMVMERFKFTSDVINLGDFPMEEGIVVVKARCRGLLDHGIYLRSANHLPFISVFNYAGNRLFCGLKAGEQSQLVQKKLNALQPITYIIYSVIWDKEEIKWYVNNLEVHREKNTMPKGEKLYLHMYSYGFKGKNMTEGNLQVDWVYVFTPKKS